MGRKKRGVFQYMSEDSLIPRRVQRTPPVSTKSVFSLTPTTGSWSGNNQLGISQAFAPDDNNRQTILKLDEWGPPVVWSVMLGVNYTPSKFTVGEFEVVGEIEIGVGGSVQRFECDWQNGTTFSACMNAINVIARYETSPNFEPPDDLELTVLLARGHLGSFPPVRSIEQTIPSSDTGPFVQLPRFTRRVTIAATSVGGIDQAVTNAGIYSTLNNVQLFSGIFTTNSINGAIRADQMLEFPNGWPIGFDAKAIRYDNNIAVPLGMRWIFHLGL